MTTSRFFTLMVFACCALRITAQPLVQEKHLAQNQNVRAMAVIDFDADVVGDDYNGFTIAYASEIYPLDQMVIAFTHLNPEQSTMMQVHLSVEEYWPLSEQIVPYGLAGGGYSWTDYDEGFFGDDHGWFGQVGLGLLFKASNSFDLYGEFVYQVSLDDLWIDGLDTSKNNNTSVNLGFRFKY